MVPGVSFFQRTYLSVPLVKLEKIRPLTIVEKKLSQNYRIQGKKFLSSKNTQFSNLAITSFLQ